MPKKSNICWLRVSRFIVSHSSQQYAVNEIITLLSHIHYKNTTATTGVQKANLVYYIFSCKEMLECNSNICLLLKMTVWSKRFVILLLIRPSLMYLCSYNIGSFDIKWSRMWSHNVPNVTAPSADSREHRQMWADAASL